MKRIAVIFLLIVLVGASGYYFYPEPKLPPNSKIDRLVVIKSKRVMHVYSGNRLIKTYHVALGGNPVGDKEVQGDKRTPEGKYSINAKNPNSGYYKNLGVSYPNASDRKEASMKGIDPGGDIKIHGLLNGIGFIGKFHRLIDWTAGCIAVTNEEMDELYNSVKIGTRIEIEP